MIYRSSHVLGAALLALLSMVSVANAQLTLVNNGDFSGGGTDWGFAGDGAGPTYPGAGGNPGGHATIDQTAGGWGGVLINDNDTPASLASLGLTAGTEYTFSVDLIDLGGGAPAAGMKIESWNGGGIIGNSGDVTTATLGAWTNHSFLYTIDAGATALKFVPLMVVQPIGSSVGFDNVGVINPIPEPASITLVGLAGVAIATMRRRRK